ncbi:unnamed protein product [Dicrocoelium dendriticum]|nr:unnamed protein product [Dicrocoelium dendriticum]
MDHPLPSNGTAVALLNWLLVCETTPSSNTCTSSTYIVAETVVPLELPELSAPLCRLNVPNIDTDTRVIRLRLDQLGSIHQLPSQCPNLTFCYDVRGFHPENHSSSIKLRLTGPVALCWYYAFRLDSVYRLTTAELGLDLHQLFLAEREESGTDSLHCDHLLSMNHVTTLLRLAPCLPNADQFESINFKALLFHKSYSSDGLSLWLTSHDLTSLTSDRDAANLTEIVRLCLPATNSSAYSSPLCIGPGAIVRAYNVHLLRRGGFSSGRITLAASALSRLDFSPPSHTAYSPTIGPLHAECRKCTSLKNRLGHRALDPPTLLAMVSEHSVDAFGKGIRIRGHITKCLEFFVCRVNRDSVHRPCATAPSELVFSIRFIVTDGSGGALVQLGPKIPPLRCNPADLYSDSAGQSNEHARLLFGLNPTSWDRLLTQIAGFVTYPDYQFAVRFEETGTSDSPTLASALRVFLTSPAFLRPHLLHLRRLPAPGKSVPRWRLRDLRLTSSDDTSAQSSRTETLSIVLPPLQLCALLAVEPFDA